MTLLERLRCAYDERRPGGFVRDNALSLSIAAVTLLLIGSISFSLYVDDFGSHSINYGSRAAIVIFLLWLYSITLVVWLNAAIDSECDLQ